MTNEQILALIIPGIIAVLGNLIFYSIVKNKIDRSIEKYKIAYAGIFKEKIDIHREILKKLYHLKFKIQQYQYAVDEKNTMEMYNDFHEFIDFYLINQPFLSNKLLDSLKKLNSEYQGCFEAFHKYHYFMQNRVDAEPMAEAVKEFTAAINKVRSNEFSEIEKFILIEMRKDLRTED